MLLTAESTWARKQAPERRARLPIAPGEWAVDMDEALGAKGEWDGRYYRF